jgi:hypothetical protein
MARLYEAQRLQKAKHLQEALAAARAGLAILRDPVILRREPPEATAVLPLTTVVEQVAQELGEPGATPEDLQDSLRFLKALDSPDAPEAVRKLRATWLPYLETRTRNTAEGPRE